MFFPLAPQSRGSYFHFMKNTLWLPVFLIVFFGVLAAVPLRGATPAEIAAQQEAEDRYKSLNATIEELKETLVAKDAGSIKRNWFVDWLWKKLETDFGFHPLPLNAAPEDRQ